MSKNFLSVLIGVILSAAICVFSSVVIRASEEIRYLEEEKAYFVTLTRKAEPRENLPTNVIVITKEQIAKSGAENIGDVLKNKTGIVEVSKRGTLGSESEIRIRSGGDSAKQVLVMVDGRPVNNIALGSANLSEIPIENIERIEIVRGPSSAVYGANALGGVVNIITKKAVDIKPKTEIVLDYGSFNTQSYKVNFSVKPSKINVFLSGSKNLTDGFRDNSSYDNLNLFLKIGYDFERYGELILSNGFSNSELGIPGPNYIYDPQTWQKIYLPERTSSSPNANQKDEKFYSQLEHKVKIKENAIKIKVYQDYHKRHYKNPDTFTDTVAEPKNFGLDYQVETINNILLGFERRYEQFSRWDSSVETINKKRDNSAIFIQKTFLLNKLSLITGIRYDYNSIYEDLTNPRISAVYRFTEDIKFSANVGTAFHAPTFEDLYSPYDPSMYTQGNPNLKPEKSIGIDLGIEYGIKSNLFSRLTLFYNDVKDFIEWAPTDPSGLWVPDNVAKVLSRGVELEIKNKITENLSQDLNYTFLESKGKQKEETYETLQYTPKHRLNYNINYLLPADIKSELVIEYTHKIEKPKLPSYTLVNFRIGRKILRSEIFFNIENIFDKRYVSRENYPLPGRTFSGGITISL